MNRTGDQGIERMNLVTAFPLPPDYWKDLDEHQIESMTPPDVAELDESTMVFGEAPLGIPEGLENDNINAMAENLKTGMNGLIEMYLAALGSCLTEDTFKNDDLLQDHLRSISQDLARLEETINRLKLHQVIKDIKESILSK